MDFRRSVAVLGLWVYGGGYSFRVEGFLFFFGGGEGGVGFEFPFFRFRQVSSKPPLPRVFEARSQPKASNQRPGQKPYAKA